MQKKYLIIGTSAAGVAAAHKIRQLDKEGSITCFTKEKELSYNKCLLADYLASIIDYPIFKTEKFFDDNAITVMTETTIVDVDRKNKFIYDSAGKSYAYDFLLLATGGDIVRPESITQNCINVFDFYMYSQTQALKEYAHSLATQTIVIIGGGLSGLECADALKNLGKKIIIIERAERVLSHQITSHASEFLQDCIQKSGIQIVMQTTIKNFTLHENKVTHVTLSDNSTIAVDMIIYALGARANLELPKKIGLEVATEGIVVNTYLQTSDTSIWAAGDNCRVYNYFTQSYVKNCTWPEAMQQGMYAAQAMTGVLKPYKGVVSVISSHFFGIKFFVAGNIYPQNSDDSVTLKYSDRHYTMIITRNSIVQGFILFGDNTLFFNLKHSLLTQSVYTI